MTTIVLTQANFKTALEEATVGCYFIINDSLHLPDQITNFPIQSVLDFRGGSFLPPSGKSKATLNLNYSTVNAPAYNIFSRSITVTGFCNSFVRAEWFNDPNKRTSVDGYEGDEVFINRAIAAAKSCPVVLEDRPYTLTGAITFPEFDNAWDAHYQGFTLISPGTLIIKQPNSNSIVDERVAIVVNAHFVTLKINKIKGYKKPDGTGSALNDFPFAGTGIKIVDSSYHSDIEVKQIWEVNKAFEIYPVSKISKDDDGNNVIVGGGIQYTHIKFEYLRTVRYGFYIDVYGGNMNNKPTVLSNWFNENHIEGGQISGVNGIYFVDRPNHLDPNKISGINGLLFENIGLEGITGLPVKLCNVSSSKFLNFRTAESLPGINDGDSFAPWFELKNVEYIEFTNKGLVQPTHINIVEGSKCNYVIFKGWIVDNLDSYYTRLDRLAITPLRNADQISGSTPIPTAYSSINPYNMSKDVVLGQNGVKTSYNISDVLPLVFTYDNDEHKEPLSPDMDTTHFKGRGVTKFNVLPRTLNVTIKDNGQNITLNLTGLSRFAQCIYNILLRCGADKGITLVTKDHPTYIIDAENPDLKSKSLKVSGASLIRLTWDSDWNLIVSKAEF